MSPFAKLAMSFGGIGKLLSGNSILYVAIIALLAGGIGGYRYSENKNGRAIAEMEAAYLQQRLNMEADQRLRVIATQNSSQKIITSLTQKLEELNSDTNVVVREVERIVIDNDSCNISVAAVQLLNDQIQAANGNARVPSTAIVPPTTSSGSEDAAIQSNVTQRELILELVEKLRAYAIVARRYEALVEWIHENYPQTKTQ